MIYDPYYQDSQTPYVTGHVEQRNQASHGLSASYVSQHNNDSPSPAAGPKREDMLKFGVWEDANYRGRYWPPPPPPATQSDMRIVSEQTPVREEARPRYPASPPLTPGLGIDSKANRRDIMAPRTNKRRRVIDDHGAEREELLNADIRGILAKHKATVKKVGRPLPRRQKERQEFSIAGKTNDERHMHAERELRLQKGSQKLTMQRQLCSADIIAYVGRSVQSVQNAKSSGLLFSELELLETANDALALGRLIMEVCFERDSLSSFGAILHLFRPDEALPQIDPNMPASEMDLTERRVETMKKGKEPFNLRDMRDKDSYRRLIEDNLIPIAYPLAKQAFQAYLDRIDKGQGSGL